MKHLIIPVIIVLALLGACKKSSDSAVPVTQSSLMFFNAVPGDELFNVMLDTIDFASNVPYATSTGYKSYRAQKYDLTVTAASQPSRVIFRQQIFLRNNRFYTAFLGADSTNRQLVLFTIEDDLTPLGPDKAKFRVIDFSQATKPNLTPLGIDVYADTFPRFFRGLAFPSLTGFAPISGDSNYVINFRWVDSSKVLKSFPLASETGKVYSLVTTGYPLDSSKFHILLVKHN